MTRKVSLINGQFMDVLNYGVIPIYYLFSTLFNYLIFGISKATRLSIENLTIKKRYF
jgi:hypothetical protein